MLLSTFLIPGVRIMFDFIVASGKPSVTRLLVPYLKAKYPEASTLVFNMGLAGPLRFAYPRGCEYSSFPRISQPEYQIILAPYTYAHSLEEYVAAQAGHTQPRWQTPDLDAGALLNAVRKAKRFVFTADPSYSVAHGYCRLLECAGIADGFSKTDAYILNALDNMSLESAFAQCGTAETVDYLKNLNRQGEVRRYFDWNWNHNALAVMRQPLSAMGLPTDTVISKYELQLLYFLANNPDGRIVHSEVLGVPPRQVPWTEGSIVAAMSRWKGSGKYERQHLGSSTSRDAIMTHLRDKGFTMVTANEEIRVTRKGFDFLALLHPGCEDADLPARLDNWMEVSLEECRPAIDRYIRTFFGKQKRFFAKNQPRR